MKRLFAVSLALFLLLAGMALAEDYSALSDDELQALNQAVQAEL